MMKKQVWMVLLCLLLVSVLPSMALAAAVTTSDGLRAAVAAAKDGDVIELGEGDFTLAGATGKYQKSLTFVGQGPGTKWTIGDLSKNSNGEANGDYSFDGADTITFRNMTLVSNNDNYRGFIRINNTVVENCVLEGRTAYWGYKTAVFKDSTFKAPGSEYALWDYSTFEMTFDNCTFNVAGKVVNVYVEAGNAKAQTKTLNWKDCKVISTAENKSALNIKNNTQAYQINISGNNTVTGLSTDKTTCSSIFQVESTSGKDVEVNVDGKTVWKNGKMLSHDYTDGEKGNKYTITDNGDGTVTKTCQICKRSETVAQKKIEIQVDKEVDTGSQNVDANMDQDSHAKLVKEANQILSDIQNSKSQEAVSTQDAQTIRSFLKENNEIIVVHSVNAEHTGSEPQSSADKKLLAQNKQEGEKAEVWELSVEMIAKAMKNGQVDKQTSPIKIKKLNNAIAIELTTGEDYTGKSVRVIHIHDGKVKQAKAYVKDAAKGIVVIEANEFSPYIILAKADQSKLNNQIKNLPKTGDDSSVFFWMTALAVSVAAIVCLTGKRRKKAE